MKPSYKPALVYETQEERESDSTIWTSFCLPLLAQILASTARFVPSLGESMH